MFRGGACEGTCGGVGIVGVWVGLCTTWEVFFNIPCNFCVYWHRLSNYCTALVAGFGVGVGVGCGVGVGVCEVVVIRFLRAV